MVYYVSYLKLIDINSLRTLFTIKNPLSKNPKSFSELQIDKILAEINKSEISSENIFNQLPKNRLTSALKHTIPSVTIIIKDKRFKSFRKYVSKVFRPENNDDDRKLVDSILKELEKLAKNK
jgi:hypothetical protein